MPRISNEKVEKILEQILSYLYSVFPKQVFTVDVAKDLARDEEFIKKLLFDLEKKGLVLRIDKNPNGSIYSRRLRWRLSGKAHEIYSKL